GGAGLASRADHARPLALPPGRHTRAGWTRAADALSRRRPRGVRLAGGARLAAARGLGDAPDDPAARRLGRAQRADAAAGAARLRPAAERRRPRWPRRIRLSVWPRPRVHRRDPGLSAGPRTRPLA